MNALLRKEIRLLLPAWVAGLGVTALPHLVSLVFPATPPSLFLILGATGVMVLWCALHSFGREFAHHTFTQLLALPVSRARVWWAKVSVLAAALGTLYAAWWFAIHRAVDFHPRIERMLADLQITPWTTALAVATLFTGSLWTTLLLRHVAAAGWFVLLLPFTTLLAADAAMSVLPVPPALRDALPAVLLGLYCVAGFLIAWRLFLRAEDAQWTGGTLSIPGLRRTASTLGAGNPATRAHRPIRALFAKELQLHYPMLLVAALVLLVHLGVAGLRSAAPALTQHPLVGAFLGAFWGFWLLMPALVNAMAIAEERQLGVMPAQFSQPVRHRTRWWTKALTSLLLGVILGTLVPCVLENSEQLPRFFTDPNSAQALSPYDHILSLALISFGCGLVSLYASSLARNTLQALGFAGVFGLLGSFIFNALGHPQSFLGLAWWNGSIGLAVSYPAVALTLLLLAAGNARLITIPGRCWLRNAAALATTLIVAGLFSSAVYHRAWEFFAETDPAHGPRRLQPESIAALQHEGQLSLRSRTGEITVFPQTFRFRSRTFANVALLYLPEWSAGVLGSNFVSHVSTYSESVAIHQNGTLWVSSAARYYLSRPTDPPEPPAPLEPFGSDTNWTTAALDPSGRGVLLLKSDGTLWRWNVTNTAHSVTLRTDSTPRRLDAGSDWTALCGSGRRIFLKSSDGAVWGVNHPVRHSLSHPDRVRRLEPGLQLDRLDTLGSDPLEWRSFAWSLGTFDLVIKNDGTLWAIGLLPWDRTRSETLLDPSTRWKTVAGNGPNALAVQDDGTLWRIDGRNWGHQPTVTRVGRQSDWLAVAAHFDAVFALSADGILWSWGSYSYHPGALEFAPSRIPMKVASLPEPAGR